MSHAKYEYTSTTTTSYGGQPGVVVSQPIGVGHTQKRDWSTGTFGCMDDLKICLCGLCCPLCLACQVSGDLGENFCIPCCVPNFLGVLRAQFRTQQGIEGTVLGDCLCIACCSLCTLCQLKREVEHCKENGSLNNPN